MSAPLLLIETATSRATVALARADGTLIAGDAWQSPHRHGEELLPRLDALLAAAGVGRRDIGGAAVGIGPGSFTGLRIGMATAKTICQALRVPIVGLPTMPLLARAAAAAGATGALAIVLPAGVGDRYLARYEVTGDSVLELQPPLLLPAGAVASAVLSGDMLVAVDLPAGEADAAAADLGQRAQSGLAGALASAASEALAAGRSADVATLVPQYVALPRGVPASTEEMAWSPDLR